MENSTPVTRYFAAYFDAILTNPWTAEATPVSNPQRLIREREPPFRHRTYTVDTGLGPMTCVQSRVTDDMKKAAIKKREERIQREELEEQALHINLNT